MGPDQIQAIVLKVATAVLKCPVAPGSDRQNTPNWDSLKHMEIVFALEDELGIQFSEDELRRLDGVSKIVDAVQSRHAA